MTRTATRTRGPMTARYRTNCPACTATITPGTEIVRNPGGGFKHKDCPEIFGTGVGARNGYAHWNEEADLMWWQECGRFGE